jgi:hypothetical protein
MTSQGTAHGRFQRAIKRGHLLPAEMAARELGALSLSDSLALVLLYQRAGELAASRIEDIELFEQGRWGLLHVRQGWDKHEGAQDPPRASRASVSCRSANNFTRSWTSICCGSGGPQGSRSAAAPR